MNKLVLLTSDNAGEDRRYFIGAVMVPENQIDTFEKTAVSLMDDIRQSINYDDNELLVALQSMGYELAEIPYEVVVRS